MSAGERGPAGVDTASEAASRARPRRRWLLHLLVPLALTVAVLLWVDVQGVLRAVAALGTGPLLLALVLALLDRVAMALKWRQLVRAAGSALAARDAVRIQFQAGAGGRAVPTAAGSELIRVYLAAQSGVPHGVILASIALEKAVALLVSVSFAAAGLLYLPRVAAGASAGIPLVAAAAVLVVAGAVLGLLLAAPAHAAAARLFGSFRLGRAVTARTGRLAGKLSAALLSYNRRRSALVVNAVLATGEYFLQLAKLYVIARGLEIGLGPLAFAAIAAVAMFVRRMAGNLDGWGLGEGAAVLIFVGLGVPAAGAVALFLTNFAVTTVAVLPGLAFFLTHPVIRATTSGR